MFDIRKIQYNIALKYLSLYNYIDRVFFRKEYVWIIIKGDLRSLVFF